MADRLQVGNGPCYIGVSESFEQFNVALFDEDERCV
jgi:hypothetical protein